MSPWRRGSCNRSGRSRSCPFHPRPGWIRPRPCRSRPSPGTRCLPAFRGARPLPNPVCRSSQPPMDGESLCTASRHDYLRAMLVPSPILLPFAALLMAGVSMADEPGQGEMLPPIEGPGVEIPGTEIPATELPALETKPAKPKVESAEEAHLDALLADLANPANENWAQTQMQIERLWKQSGSPSMDLLAERAEKAIKQKDLEVALDFLDDLTRLA